PEVVRPAVPVLPREGRAGKGPVKGQHGANRGVQVASVEGGGKARRAPVDAARGAHLRPPCGEIKEAVVGTDETAAAEVEDDGRIGLRTDTGVDHAEEDRARREAGAEGRKQAGRPARIVAGGIGHEADDPLRGGEPRNGGLHLAEVGAPVTVVREEEDHGWAVYRLAGSLL